MPAAAVIPAPIAYTNVVAVKKLVVGCARAGMSGAGSGAIAGLSLLYPLGDGMRRPLACDSVRAAGGILVTVKKLECSRRSIDGID